MNIDSSQASRRETNGRPFDPRAEPPNELNTKNQTDPKQTCVRVHNEIIEFNTHYFNAAEKQPTGGAGTPT